MPGIQSFGYYLPRCSIRASEYERVWGSFPLKGVREKTVPSYDEDEMTMAVEACRRALDFARGGRKEVGLLVAASGSPREPFGQGVAEALGCTGARVMNMAGPTAGVAGLISALESGGLSGRAAVVVSADAPVGAPDDPLERGLGAGAAAFVLSKGGGVRLGPQASASREDYARLSTDAQGFVRETGDKTLSLALLREAVGQVLPSAGAPPIRIAAGEEHGRFLQEALGPLLQGQGLASGVVAFTGYAGASGPLLNLVVALGGVGPSESILLAGHGNGTASAAILHVTTKPAGVGIVTDEPREDRRYLTYEEYVRMRGFLRTATANRETALGAYIPLADYQGSVAARYRLQGQECSACGAVLFPPGPLCPRCSQRDLKPKELSPRGKVHSYTIIGRGAAPTEFLPQQEAVGEYVVALVELEDGPRIAAQLTDCEPRAVEMGMAVTMALRRLYRQEGVVRYGFKFRPSGLRGTEGR